MKKYSLVKGSFNAYVNFMYALLKLAPMEMRGWEGKIYLIVDYLAM